MIWSGALAYHSGHHVIFSIRNHSCTTSALWNGTCTWPVWYGSGHTPYLYTSTVWPSSRWAFWLGNHSQHCDGNLRSISSSLTWTGYPLSTNLPHSPGSALPRSFIMHSTQFWWRSRIHPRYNSNTLLIQAIINRHHRTHPSGGSWLLPDLCQQVTNLGICDGTVNHITWDVWQWWPNQALTSAYSWPNQG